MHCKLAGQPGRSQVPLQRCDHARRSQRDVSPTPTWKNCRKQISFRAGPGAGVGAGVGARPGVADERVLGIVSILLTFSAPCWYLVEDFGDYNTSELAS